MNASLEGRAAFISGAGHGIGRATALAMARLGATVGVNDLKPEFVDDTVAEIRRARRQGDRRCRRTSRPAKACAKPCCASRARRAGWT